jgi:hypothetical protein
MIAVELAVQVQAAVMASHHSPTEAPGQRCTGHLAAYLAGAVVRRSRRKDHTHPNHLQSNRTVSLRSISVSDDALAQS